MNDFVIIDGSFGEGGGQILRSSLSLSLITGKPFRITKIRAGREKPGLGHQHLEAIQAAAQISGSQAEGAVLRSVELSFAPGPVAPGDYTFAVTTAGAMPLVLHTVFLPLVLSGRPSFLQFRGGTHVPWAPSYEYLSAVWQHALAACGVNIQLAIHKAGYYPQGGGEFSARLEPVARLRPLTLLARPPLQKLHLICVASNLPPHVAEREYKVVDGKAGGMGLAKYLAHTSQAYPSPGPGHLLFMQVDMGACKAGFTAIGVRGKPAETVAEEMWQEFAGYWSKEAPVDPYLADQLLLPLSFASGPSSYRVSEVSQHLLTNAHIIRLFCDVDITISGKEGEMGLVAVKPA
jgi:RNA 3'-terminal phosphate cyclase (ATP)